MSHQARNNNSESSPEEREPAAQEISERDLDSGEMKRSVGYEYDDDYNRGPAYYDDHGQYDTHESERFRSQNPKARERAGSQGDRDNWERSLTREESDAQRQFDRSTQEPRDYSDDHRDDTGRSYQYGERDGEERTDSAPSADEQRSTLHSQQDYTDWREDGGFPAKGNE